MPTRFGHAAARPFSKNAEASPKPDEDFSEQAFPGLLPVSAGIQSSGEVRSARPLKKCRSGLQSRHSVGASGGVTNRVSVRPVLFPDGPH